MSFLRMLLTRLLKYKWVYWLFDDAKSVSVAKLHSLDERIIIQLIGRNLEG